MEKRVSPLKQLEKRCEAALATAWARLGGEGPSDEVIDELIKHNRQMREIHIKKQKEK